MKPIHKLLLFILSTSLAFVFIGNSYKSDETPVALVKKIVKDVQYKTSDESDWEIAQSGKPLVDGGEVKTGLFIPICTYPVYTPPNASYITFVYIYISAFLQTVVETLGSTDILATALFKWI